MSKLIIISKGMFGRAFWRRRFWSGKSIFQNMFDILKIFKEYHDK